VNTGRRRLGILGGTFDPVHHGHLIMASELRAALSLDSVLLVPNARSPFKPDDSVTSGAHRAAMLKLVVNDTPWLELSTIELDRGDVSYTVDTLSALSLNRASETLVFLVGADSLIDLHRWREPAEILRLAEIGVASRPGTLVDTESVVEQLPAAAGRITVVTTPLIAISATDIRHRVRTGLPIAFQVPPAVEHYIRDHRLYLD
jgi:nicotinate-nucleotide adenylyltransferase